MDKKYIVLFVMCICIFFVKYHGFGTGNVSEIMPLTLRMEDPSYLQNDWYVNASGPVNARTNFIAFTMAANLLFNNYEITYLVLAFLFFCLFAVGFLKLMEHLTGDSKLALFATSLPLLIGSYGLGNSFIIGDYLNPGFITWAFIIWGLLGFFQKQYTLSFMIIGVASYFQAMSAYIVAAILVLTLLFSLKFKEAFGAWAFAALFFLFNAKLLMQELFTKTYLSSSQLAYILADFRLPHHYFPTSYLLWISFIGFFLVFIWAYYKSQIKNKQMFMKIVMIILTLALISFFFSKTIPWGFVTKLRLIRAFELLNIIEFIFIGEWLFKMKSKLLAVIMMWLLVIPCYVYTDVYLDNPIGRYKVDPKLDELCNFVKVNTPEDAIFLVPLDMSSFRYYCNRAVVVDWKMHTYKTNTLAEWYHRVTNVGYRNLDFLIKEYNVDYVVEEVEGGYRVYETENIEELPQNDCVGEGDVCDLPGYA